MIAAWQPTCGPTELALALRRGRPTCIMILPALFDEANKLRHFTVEMMRALDSGGADCVLPDLPGCNESCAPLAFQTLPGWQAYAAQAAQQLGATHVLAMRGGALIAPDLPGWRYASLSGDAILRGLLRGRVLASREAGVAERREDLLDQGRSDGLELAGYQMGPTMVRELEQAEPRPLPDIAQTQLGGPGLWLRAEPGHDPDQARAVATIVLRSLV